MTKSLRTLTPPVLLALAALLAGCTLPPYNEELSLAQVTRSKLGQPVNKIGPVYAQLDDNARQTSFYFLPDRNDMGTMGGGFLVAMADYGLRAWYLAYYSTNGGLSASFAIGLENATGTANSYLLQPLRSASGGALSLIRYLPSSSYLGNTLTVLNSSDPAIITPSTPLVLSEKLTATPPPTVIAAGSSISPQDDAIGFDVQYFLGYAIDLGYETYVEVKFNTNASSGIDVATIATISSDFTLSPLPPDLRNVFYGHADSTNLSYLSYWSAAEGKYKSYSWTPTLLAPPPADPPDLKPLPGIRGRIDAVLSDGRLLSFDGGVCTVYGPAGFKLFDFPLGGLKFCYERQDSLDGQFKLYFSLAYWQYGRDEKPDQLYVEVYAIPTANLRNLN